MGLRQPALPGVRQRQRAARLRRAAPCRQASRRQHDHLVPLDQVLAAGVQQMKWEIVQRAEGHDRQPAPPMDLGRQRRQQRGVELLEHPLGDARQALRRRPRATGVEREGDVGLELRQQLVERAGRQG